MRVMQAIALSSLCGATMLFASIPVIAVVVHKRHESDHLATVYPSTDKMMLYDKHGYRVATCKQKDENLSHCKIEDGYGFDDVMNAWLNAYMNR